MKNKKITKILLTLGLLSSISMKASEEAQDAVSCIDSSSLMDGYAQRIDALEAEQAALIKQLKELTIQFVECQHEKDQLECELIAERAGENEAQKKLFTRVLAALKLLLKQKEAEILQLQEENAELRKVTA